MGEIIKWCNDNNGFLTGILSLLTLFVSVFAVVVSIRTARLSYMKRLILSSDITILFGTNDFTGNLCHSLQG